MIFYDKEKNYQREEVGGKALGLLSLLHMGCNVPDFFIVSAGTDVSAPTFAKQLESAAERLDCSLFAVRSSGVAEDAEVSSFAGQYDTLLNVQKSQLLAAVQNVVASAKSKRLQTYSKRLNEKTSEIAVIVQRQIAPIKAGVAFSTSPLDGTKAIVESGQGQGEALVSGEITPDTFTFSKGEKTATGIEGEVFVLSQTLEKQMGKPVDIEWAYEDKLYLLQMRPLTVLPVQINVADGKWNEYVYRNFAFLNHYVQALASGKQPQEKEFGFHIPIFEGLLVDGHEFYSEYNDIKTGKLWKKLDKGDFFEQFIQRLYRLVESTKRHVRRLKQADFSRESNQQLAKAFRLEMQRYLRSYLPLMMRPDEYLTARLQACMGQADEIIFPITYPVKRTAYQLEKFDFLRAAIAYGQGDTALLNAYVNKYEWINAPLGKSFTPLEKEEVIKRISVLKPGEAKEKLATLKGQRKKNLALRKKLHSNVHSATQKRWISLLAEFVYLRTYTTENSDRYFYYIKKKMLREIAKRTDVPLETLLYCTPQEIQKLLLGERFLGQAIARRHGTTFHFTEKGFFIYEGNGLPLLKRLLPAPKENVLLKGSVAASGSVCANVKIITSFEELEKLEKGDILVTKMTTPELVRAMEQASGIITDEGGVTCHAAIIAREYAIPCLVGTGIATKVLKDGMKVALDCVHGTCKIVK